MSEANSEYLLGYFTMIFCSYIFLHVKILKDSINRFEIKFSRLFEVSVSLYLVHFFFKH
jgi:hypothetical protein